jgi:conjugative transfer region protein TrbK
MNDVGRTIAYVALAGALLATAITLDDRRHPAGEAGRGGASLVVIGGDAELARCKAIDVEDADDVGCKALWQANRWRFFQLREPDRDRRVGSFLATGNAKADAPAVGGEVPRSSQRWLSKPDSDSLRPPVDNAGQRK